MSTPLVWILIPAFNEAPRIGQVIRDLRRHGWYQLLVVNDGSTDATATVAAQCGARVLTLPTNCGQGAALAAGMQYLAQRLSPDIIVTFDADGQHRAADIAALLEPIRRETADIVLGSRFLGGGSAIPRWRGVILRFGVFLTRLLSGLTVTDTHNGLRALHRRAYCAITLTDPGMGHASELLYQVSRRHLRYTEVPVTILYPPRHSSQPLLRCIPLGFKFLLLAWRA